MGVYYANLSIVQFRAMMLGIYVYVYIGYDLPTKLTPYQSLTITPLHFPPNKLTVTRNDDQISTSPRNIDIYMTIFEQNCNNLKMAAIGRNL